MAAGRIPSAVALGCACALGVLSLSPTLAVAQDAESHAQAQLRWVRLTDGAGCVAQERLRSMVNQRLGRQVFSDSSEDAWDVQVAGSVGAEPGGGWLATLVVVRANGGEVGGVREVRSAAGDCNALTESVALVLSLMVDMPRPVVSIRIPEEPRRDVSASWIPGVEFRLVIAAGDLPVARYGVRADIFNQTQGGLRIGLGLSAERSATLDAGGFSWVTHGLTASAALSVRLVTRSSWSFGISAEAAAGALTVDASSLSAALAPAAYVGSELWVRAGSQRRRGLFALGIRAPLIRHSFMVLSQGGAESEAASGRFIGVTVAAGLELR